MATPSKKTKKKSILTSAKQRFVKFMKIRPHRSFRLTKRRDYARPLELPGFISFTAHVNRIFWTHKKLLLGLVLVASVVSILLIGVGSQLAYTNLVDVLQTTSAGVFEGGWGEVERSLLLLASIAGLGVGGGLGETQQAYAIIVILFTWMTTVWLLRNSLAKNKIKLRDGLYSASSPMVATFILSVVLIVQMLPAGLAAIGYSAAVASGLLAGGVEAMLFWVAAGSLVLISLFWAMSTLFAMVIVTLPGTYPMKAFSIAGGMILGRRLRILYRILWMFLCVAVAWVIVLIPAIVFDSWLKGVWEQIAWLPLIPVLVLLMTSLTSVWVSTYIYLLYRKVVDEDARHE